MRRAQCAVRVLRGAYDRADRSQHVWIWSKSKCLAAARTSKTRAVILMYSALQVVRALSVRRGSAVLQSLYTNSGSAQDDVGALRYERATEHNYLSCHRTLQQSVLN